MKKILAFVLLGISFSSYGQLTSSQVIDTINTKIPDNSTRLIKPRDIRDALKTLVQYSNSSVASAITNGNYVTVENAQTITGQKTFSGGAVFGNSSGSVINLKRPGGDNAGELGMNGNADVFLLNRSGDFAGTRTANMYFGLDETSGGAFVWGNANYSGQRMRLNRNSGNLIIGGLTTDTGDRLQVTGNAKITGAVLATGEIVGLRLLGYGGGNIWLNSAVGSGSLFSNTTGSRNVASGANALYSNTTGSRNIAYGVAALFSNTTGGFNTAIGDNSMLFSNTGNNNIAIGFSAGRNSGFASNNVSTPNNSIFIGSDSKPLDNNQINEIVIGYSATGLGSNTTVLGNTSTLTTRIFGDLLIGTSTSKSSVIANFASTTKGLLPPVMTAVQASAISPLEEGLMLYVTNTNGTFTSKGWWGFNGATWEKFNN